MKPPLLLVLIAGSILLGLAVHSSGQSPTQPPEAITGFDDQSNGFSDLTRRQADQKVFEEIEHIAPDGLGPLYKATISLPNQTISLMMGSVKATGRR